MSATGTLMAGSVHVSLTGDNKTLDSAVVGSKKGLKDLGEVTSKTGIAMGLAFGAISLAATAAFGIVANSVRVAMDFEAQISNIKALTGATAQQSKAITGLALQLGKDTKFSALEAAKGIEELLKAGVSLEKVMAGGAAGALALAAAGEIEVAEAAEIASTALNAFSKDNLEVTRVADIMAGAANASATSVGELKMGLAQSAAVASGVGLTFQDTSGALALFAQNGLKGSDAGTSLKTMLMNLQPQTKAQIAVWEEFGFQFVDTAGHFKNMGEIAGEIKTKLSGLTDAQRASTLETMFGSDAIRAGNILYKEGAEGIAKMQTEMGKFTAAEVAKEKMNNLKGSMDNLKSTIETMNTELGLMFTPAITEAVRGFTNVLNAVDVKGLADSFGNFGKEMQTMFGPQLTFIGELINRQLVPAFKEIWVAIEPNLIPTLKVLGTILTGVVVVALVVVVETLSMFAAVVSSVMIGCRKNFDTFKGSLFTTFEAIKGIFDGFMTVIKGVLTGDMTTVIEGAKRIILGLGQLNLMQLGKDMIQGLIDGIGSMAGALWNKMTDMANSAMNAVKDIFKINSPSLAMKNIGVGVVQGYNLGIDAQIPTLEDKMMKMSQIAMQPMKGMSNINSSNSGNSYDYSDNRVYNTQSQIQPQNTGFGWLEFA
jgi:TP901 family phage tail tape measure protein